MRRVVWVVCAVLLAQLGCSKDEASSGDKGAKPAAAEGPAAAVEQPEAVPEDQPGGDALRAHMNLMALAHLAEIDQGGLFVDFGTPARMKYTAGHWRTGWGKDATEGGTSFTRAGPAARLYVDVERPGPYTLALRVKPVATENLTVYMNNEALPLVKMSRAAGFAEYQVGVPAEHVVAGENQIMLRFGDSTSIGGEDVSADVDYVRLSPAPAGGAPDAPAAPPGELPTYERLVRKVSVGGQERPALTVQAPATLTWYLEVPRDAKLSLRVGQAAGKGAKASARIVPEGGEAKSLFETELSDAWASQVVSLAPWAGQVVRLDLAAQGAGTVGWSSPAVLVPGVQLADKPKPAKNVLVLLIDTLRADKLRPYNPKSRVATPALDEIARQGVVFDEAQAPENWTKPSVASILTGLYPRTHQTKKSESKLSDKALMVSEVFKQNGFATGTFLANGYVSDKFGFDQGWDHYTNYIRENKNTEAENVFHEAGDWIEKHKDERFFVYIQTIDPHVPYDPPDEFLKMYDPGEYTGPVSPRKTPDLLEKAKRNPPKVTFTARDRQRLEALHDAEISYHDKYLGELVARLKRLGLYEDLVFVVVSDHGEEFYEHGSYGHGHSVYQEMLHVPFIVRWPGVLEPGKRIGETVGTLDVSPTILSAAGVAVPDVMEGVDRISHMRGLAPAGPDVGFSDFLDDRRVIRAGRWKLILRGLNATLFDLEKDPGEQKELAPTDHPIAMRYCRVMLGQFLGTHDLRHWLEPAKGGDAKGLDSEDTEIDAKTREGLKALGYAN